MSENTNPAVSVIIPTYNRAVYLAEAIESVLLQSEQSFEVVIVDDGGSDDSESVANSFNDKRISYFRIEHAGVSTARNEGVRKSKGPFIAFLDSDDIWLADKLKSQLAFFAQNPRASICQTEEIWIRNGVRVNPHKKHKKRSGWIFRDCIPLCIVSPSAVMMRREVFEGLGGFDESLPACEDYDLWLRATLRYEIFTMDEPLIIKRGGHADQLSRGWGLDLLRMRALAKLLCDPMLDEENRSLVVADINRRAEIVKKGAVKRGNQKLLSEVLELTRYGRHQ